MTVTFVNLFEVPADRDDAFLELWQEVSAYMRAKPGYVGHKLHRAFGLLPAMVQAVLPGDTARSAIIAAHAREMVDVLHHHHSGEDELIWPRLRQRAQIDTELVAGMEAQHERVAEILGPLDGLLEQWSRTADPAQRDGLSTLLARLPAALNEHLDEDESRILPIVERALTAGQWAEVADRGMASMPRPRLLVFLGHILEEANPAETAAFLRHVPLPGRVGYRLLGRRKYEREIAAQRRDIDTRKELCPESRPGR